MAISYADELRPGYKGPLIDSNVIRGGFYQVDTWTELNAIPTSQFKKGMLVYIAQDTEAKIYTYQWNGEIWEKAKLSGGIDKIETEAEKSIMVPENGDVVYISDQDRYEYYYGGQWLPFGTFWVGDTPPTNTSLVWVDPTGNNNMNHSGQVTVLEQEVKTLQEQVGQLMRILKYGAIAGDALVGGRTGIMAGADPINPNTGEPEDPDVIEPPVFQPTVPNIVIKKDTRENFRQHTNNLLDGELVYILSDDGVSANPGLFIYLGGRFSPISNGTSQGGEIQPEDEMTDQELKEKILSFYLTQYGLVDSNNKQYAVTVNEEGSLVVYNDSKPWEGAGLGSALNPDSGNVTKGRGGSYVSNFLRINSFFASGSGCTPADIPAATHNFVEITNAGPEDINLHGLYLMYCPVTLEGTTKWNYIPLKGILKSASSYLIRGAKVGVPGNHTVSVKDADEVWYDFDGTEIKFSELGGCWYLCVSKTDEDGTVKVYSKGSSSWVPINSFPVSTPYTTDIASIPFGYIDLVGVINTTSLTTFSEGGAISFQSSGEDIKKCIFFRKFGCDPGFVAGVSPNWDKRNNQKTWTWCNMDKEDTPEYPYFTEDIKVKMAPGSTKNGNPCFFKKRSEFSFEKPNCINLGFTKQATEAAVQKLEYYVDHTKVSETVYNSTSGTDHLKYTFDTSKAGRCLNWVSLGYYDEYVEYRKVGQTEWTKLHSISSDNLSTDYLTDPVVQKFQKVYVRLKWASASGKQCTTHKAILRGLTAGTYEYRIGREGNELYTSGIRKFIVHTDAQVTNFTFVQTTDQQGFNYMEYAAWRKAAYCIQRDQPNYNFSINTGDMCQSGVRESEWIDYWRGREVLGDKEEMPVIGNNDLSRINYYLLDTGSEKFNSTSIWLFYCFDLDIDNPAYFHYKHTGSIDPIKLRNIISFDNSTNSFEYFMPSVYSFNYGAYHFIALNSEFVTNAGSATVYYSELTTSEAQAAFKASAYYSEYRWLKKDTELYGTGKKKIAYCHELPFCIVKCESSPWTAIARTETNGSKLNASIKDGYERTLYTDDNKDLYTGGCSFSEFFQNNDIKLVLGGHKHTYSLSWPTKESISGSGSGRTVAYNAPILDKRDTSQGAKADGVVYAMLQATGYKLESNNDKPGRDIPWLRKYFPYQSGGSLNTGQQYPMYTTCSCSGTGVQLRSYWVDGIYDHSGTPVKEFDINNQYSVNSVSLKEEGTSNDLVAHINY